jgi:hypothetical protein
MKNFKKVILSLTLFAAMPARAGDPLDKIAPVDKQLHFLASFGLEMTATRLFERLHVSYPELWAAVVVGSIGASKELFFDRTGDRDDMKANAIGIGLAAGVNYSLRF